MKPLSEFRPGTKHIWICTWILIIGVTAYSLFGEWLKSFRHAGLSIDGRVLWGRDFVNVYTSGELLLRNQLSILYDVKRYRAFQTYLFAPAQLQGHNYSYPPVTLFYTWLFALMPYPAALVTWLGITGAAFVASARPYFAAAGQPWWLAIVLPASLVNIWAGHYGFVVGALWLAAWHLLDKRPRLAGVLIGLMMVKPHLAILAPVVLAWRREWVAFIAAAITAATLVFLSAAIFGIELWHTYLTVTATYQAGLIDKVGTFFIRMMPTVAPSLAMLGASDGVAIALQAVVGAVAVVMLLRFLPADNRRAGLATGVATFLVLPYVFSYDMTVVSVAGVIIFAAACNRGSLGLALLTSLAFLTPVIMTTVNRFGFTIAPLMVALTLYWLLRQSITAPRRAAPTDAALAH